MFVVCCVRADLNGAVPREEDELFRPCIARVFILTCRLMLDYACFPVYRSTSDAAEDVEPVKLRPSPSSRKCVTPPPGLVVESIVTTNLKRSRSQSPSSRDRSRADGQISFDKSLFLRLAGGGVAGSGKSTTEEQKNVKKLTNR